jgi:hypothetical protein
MYALIQAGAVVAYPYSIGQFQIDNPNVSLPMSPTTAQLNEVGIYAVVPSIPPTASVGQVVEETTPELISGVWTQAWAVRSAAPAEVAQQEQALLVDIVAATQARLDAFARTRGYDDIKSASGYAGCAVSKFDAEGTYCRDVRAETWAKLYEMLDEVKAGIRPMPDGFADIEPELPALVWAN